MLKKLRPLYYTVNHCPPQPRCKGPLNVTDPFLFLLLRFVFGTISRIPYIATHFTAHLFVRCLRQDITNCFLMVKRITCSGDFFLNCSLICICVMRKNKRSLFRLPLLIYLGYRTRYVWSFLNTYEYKVIWT